jgi:hypothetical protein
MSMVSLGEFYIHPLMAYNTRNTSSDKPVPVPPSPSDWFVELKQKSGVKNVQNKKKEGGIPIGFFFFLLCFCGQRKRK